MRVLYANKYNYLKGGCERVLFTEMELMRGRGHEAAVFASRHPENAPGRYSEDFVEEENYFNASLAHKAKAALKIVYSPEALEKFGRVLDDFRPDLVHAHNIYAQLSTAVLDAARRRGVPVVLTAHDYQLVCPSYMMLDHGEICEKCAGNRFYHCFLTACHKESRTASAVYTAEAYFTHWTGKYSAVRRFICPSRFMASKLSGRFAEGKLAVLDNPVDLSAYRPASRDEGYYLFAGRLSKEKGAFTLIRAFAEMGLPLKVVGTGPLEAECRKLAEGAPRIELTGYRTGRELEGLYQGARACVVPSEWYENAPMSVIEAMAYAKPVVAARIGGIPELVRDGENGLLFTPFDAGDLKGKVRRLQGFGPADYAALCRRARETAEARFSLEAHYEGLMKIYKEALEAKP